MDIIYLNAACCLAKSLALEHNRHRIRRQFVYVQNTFLLQTTLLFVSLSQHLSIVSLDRSHEMSVRTSYGLPMRIGYPIS